MRMSDWSSDVCSSDLSHGERRRMEAKSAIDDISSFLRDGRGEHVHRRAADRIKDKPRTFAVRYVHDALGDIFFAAHDNLSGTGILKFLHLRPPARDGNRFCATHVRDMHGSDANSTRCCRKKEEG